MKTPSLPERSQSHSTFTRDSFPSPQKVVVVSTTTVASGATCAGVGAAVGSALGPPGAAVGWLIGLAFGTVMGTKAGNAISKDL